MSPQRSGLSCVLLALLLTASADVLAQGRTNIRFRGLQIRAASGKAYAIPGGPVRDADGTPVDYDIEAQTRAVIDNVRHLFHSAASRSMLLC